MKIQDYILRNSPTPTTKPAFALILAIVAMAFMVLLTLTLSSLITSKMRLMNAHKQSHIARSNALLGLSVAISELQSNLGKDNAVSFNSSILDTSVDTPKIDGVKAPYVLGVMSLEKEVLKSVSVKEHQDSYIDIIDTVKEGGNSEKVAWLISSEKRMKNPMSESVSDLSRQTVKLAEYKTLSEYPSEFGGMVDSALKNEKVEVLAGKVEVGSDGSNSASGAYAWWISDESQKAKLNLIRPKEYLNESMGDSQNCEAPADSRVPQIVNTSFIEKLAPLELNPFLKNFNKSVSENLAKINNLSEMALVDSSLSSWGKDNFNDYTATSVGLPVDVTQGRLKQDLTAYLQGGYGLDDKTPIVRGSSKDKNYTGVNFGLSTYSENLPTFGLLKGFANVALGATKFDDKIAPTAHVFDQSKNQEYGVAPQIILAQWIIYPCYEYVGNKVGVERFTTKAGDKIRLGFMLYPKIVIWNPHNVALESSDYVVRLYMPLRFEMSGLDSSKNEPYVATTFVRFDATKKDAKGNITWTAQSSYKERLYNVYIGKTKNNGYFSEFIKDKADNNMPVMNFQIKGLALRAGESVELRPKYSPNQLNRYQDLSPSELAGSSSNILEAGKLAFEDGTSSGDSWGMNKGLGVFIPTEVEFTSRGIPQIDDTFTWVENSKTGAGWTNGEDIGSVKYVPFSRSLRIALDSTDRLNFVEDEDGAFSDAPIFMMSGGYNNNSFFRFIGGGDGGGFSNNIYQRAGYELLLNRGGLKRVAKLDYTEWSGSSPSSYNDVNGRSRTHNYHQQTGTSVFAVGDTVSKATSSSAENRGILQEAIKLNSAKIGAISKKNKSNYGEFAIGFESDRAFPSEHFLAGNSFLMGFRTFHAGMLTNLFFSAYNVRATNVKNSVWNDDNAVIRRTEKVNHSLGAKASRNSTSVDQFLGNMTGKESGRSYSVNGYYSWDLSNVYGIPNSEISYSSNKTLLNLYSGSAGDSQSGGRFSMYSFLSGDRGYKYDAPIAAHFDLPRDENDLMSLAVFSHANLSPMHWQPTAAFATSYASPFIDRDKIIDKETPTINANELIDISYILNSSMWDRFYLSTIPQKKAFKEYAGMRLANTRLFLTSTPKERRELCADDDAFENSAKYVAIDGAFNVNSTSYEAWRAVLGGLLGTKKKTLDSSADSINKQTKSSDAPDDFKMPNPGDLNPISTPEENQYFTFMDNMVGRRISESEIDMLAREIVAEVKRRAPFFSLADFVNRRLKEYENGTDDKSLDARFQGIMGTLAAAIKRCEQSQSHKKTYFNSRYLDPMPELMDKAPQCDTLSKISLVSSASTITAYDNIPARSHLKDLGEQVKRNEKQYIEHAIQTPVIANAYMNKAQGAPGLLSQEDLLNEIGSFITVRGDTFIVRAYGEAKNAMTGDTSKAYCEALVQRVATPVNPQDDTVAPQSPFGRRFKIISFRWLTPNEI